MDFKKKIPFVFFICFLLGNIFFWTSSHKIKSSWANVPPVPSKQTASMMALGDDQLAYRVNATMLQNLGNTGGRNVSLKDYDYNRLKDWFFLSDYLDPLSNVVPMLAATYFGAVEDKDKLANVLDYLVVAGSRPEGEKWRWLGHGVFLAKHILKDNEKALEMAYILADNKSPDLADWAKQMPAFILQEEGQNELAYKIMLNILISNVDTMHPNEVNFMKDYICNTILKDEKEIEPPPFCSDGSIRS